ncbi:hypothetical protein GCM10009639_54950 [Kitasatospora putterlickiae]|uniref:Uncharacterized protein n=1 Tax=Kitasatospora putterlickiae TaxID=221725 RepID=A0ABP4J2F4_9ACTN
MLRSVPRAGRVLAVAATLCGAPAVLWVVLVGGSLIDGPLVLGSLGAAAPLLARDATAFRTACLVFGWGLLAVSVLGALIGLFVLAPAGVVLLTAASRARPEPRCLPLLLGTLVATATLGFAGWRFGTTSIAPYFQEPDAFVATVQKDSPLLRTGPHPELLWDGSGLGHGATLVSMRETDSVRLVVVFDTRTSDADLAVLRRLLADLPGVATVRLCDPPAGNCR